jgi:two-component system sensor histidine kinase UhpB
LKVTDDVAIVVYRVIQESLTNIARHSGASAAQVHLNGSNGLVTARVVDNGIGFSRTDGAASAESFGILGMRERIKGLGGKFNIDSRPGEGTEISFEIPLTATELDHD